jgi:hypothetical protein
MHPEMCEYLRTEKPWQAMETAAAAGSKEAQIEWQKLLRELNCFEIPGGAVPGMPSPGGRLGRDPGGEALDGLDGSFPPAGMLFSEEYAKQEDEDRDR